MVGSFLSKNLLKINNFSNDKSENGINCDKKEYILWNLFKVFLKSTCSSFSFFLKVVTTQFNILCSIA